MKLSRLEEDLRIHQKLEDEPNDVGGLSAQALKEKFDQAGVTIQQYLNETHLPEEEKAAEELLAQAKAYTDQKVVAVGTADMATAVYDTKGRRTDVFEYAEEKAKEAMAQTAGAGYVLVGRSGAEVTEGRSYVLELKEHTPMDPKGIWAAEEKSFVMPEGAKGVIITLHLRWARQTFGHNYLRIRVNGEEVHTYEGPENTAGTFIEEVVPLAVPVEGGDRVQVCLDAVKGSASSNNLAYIRLYFARVEVLM